MRLSKIRLKGSQGRIGFAIERSVNLPVCFSLYPFSLGRMVEFLVVGMAPEVKLSGFKSPFHGGLCILGGRCIPFPCLVSPVSGWLVVGVATVCTEVLYAAESRCLVSTRIPWRTCQHQFLGPEARDSDSVSLGGT